MSSAVTKSGSQEMVLGAAKDGIFLSIYTVPFVQSSLALAQVASRSFDFGVGGQYVIAVSTKSVALVRGDGFVEGWRAFDERTSSLKLMSSHVAEAVEAVLASTGVPGREGTRAATQGKTPRLRGDTPRLGGKQTFWKSTRHPKKGWDTA